MAKTPRGSAAFQFASLVCAGLTAAVLAQGGEPLTNDDVVRMVRATLSSRVIVATIESATSVTFDLSPTGLITLKSAGADDRVIESMLARAPARGEGQAPSGRLLEAPEKSDQLQTSKDPEVILRSFRTMLVDASHASFFGNDQMKAALWQNADFEALKVAIVENSTVADVVLTVGYTFAWDYPFSLIHQNTSVVLVSGRGSGPFSGPAGANSVARELATLLKAYRLAPPKPKARNPGLQ